MRINLLLFLSLLLVSVVGKKTRHRGGDRDERVEHEDAASKLEITSVVLDDKKWKAVQGEVEDAIAVAYWEDSVDERGWGVLTVIANKVPHSTCLCRSYCPISSPSPS